MALNAIGLIALLTCTSFIGEVEGQGGGLIGNGRFQDCVVAPKECPNKNVTFYLYNRKLGDSPYQLVAEDEANLRSAPLVTNSSLVVLIHGYTGYRDYSPNMELRPAFLAAGDYNIISIDFGPLVLQSCYAQAVMNVPTVANCSARLLKALYAAQNQTKDGQPAATKENTHVVGFSLGAHVAGRIGALLQMPWVTGLDPALPMFNDFTSNSDSRLDPSDADFVDVIHTNAGVKGKFFPVGHIDFYCNSGTVQPGCSGNRSCDHVRSVEYYAESLTTKVGFYGAPCTLNSFGPIPEFGDLRYADFVNTPEESLQLMGAYVDHSARGIYQVLTNNKPPFARGKNSTGLPGRKLINLNLRNMINKSHN